MLSSTGTRAAFVAVPSSPVEAADVVPALHTLGDALVSESAAAIDRERGGITCRFGCTACCYQLVPVTDMEARFLNKTVDSLPVDQSDAVRANATAVVRDLEAEGLLSEMGRFDQLSRSDLESLTLRYFRMHAPCPFLDGETCSIYEQRPLACREYLVTSPSECCRAARRSEGGSGTSANLALLPPDAERPHRIKNRSSSPFNLATIRSLRSVAPRSGAPRASAGRRLSALSMNVGGSRVHASLHEVSRAHPR